MEPKEENKKVTFDSKKKDEVSASKDKKVDKEETKNTGSTYVPGMYSRGGLTDCYYGPPPKYGGYRSIRGYTPGYYDASTHYMTRSHSERGRNLHCSVYDRYKYADEGEYRGKYFCITCL